jgi:predicted metalloprotease with PDZ domain
VAAIGLVGLYPKAVAAQSLEPIVFRVSFVSLEKHHAEVAATIPARGHDAIELLMPVWSPGFYRVEDYARRVSDLKARTPDEAVLDVTQPTANRWLIRTGGSPKVVVTYRLSCEQRSVTTNWVGDDLVVLNGAATFLTLVEKVQRPHEVRLELPPTLPQSTTALDPAADGVPNHYRALDYETLVDSPILAGKLVVRSFAVDGSEHQLIDAGDIASDWDGKRVAQDLEKIVKENRLFWGFLPFKRYLFLNVFRRGGGGLEHKNCTLLTSSPAAAARPRSHLRWLDFVSHEYFHAFNVKRLRPVELGPFDFEHPPQTASLWISEGLTSYYGALIVCRAGLGTTEDFLATLGGYIGQLQNAPGRLVQTLEKSSLDVWTSGFSGLGRDHATKVSYYVKGPIVGFLLDARIRKATAGKKSLDDVMRLAYKRYGGERGFTPAQFRATAGEVAGVDLNEWFRRAIASTEELDYAEALDWFGLRFAAANDPKKAWNLELLPAATDDQKDHLRRLMGHAGDRRDASLQ